MKIVGRHLLLAGLVWVGGLTASGRSYADEITDRYCPQFHAECVEAKEQGYRDVGICNVERLECRADDDARAPKRSHESQHDETQDPEESHGERSIGP